MEFLMDIEYWVLDGIQMIRTGWLDSAMVFISSLVDHAEFWLAIAAVMLFFKKYRKFGLMIIIALISGYLIGNLGMKNLVGRLRPYTNRPDIVLLVKNPMDYAFPSGHTLCSFEAAGILYYMDKRVGWGALVVAALIGFSRIYLYVHYLTDVLGGMILGLAIAYIVTKIFEKKFHVYPLDMQRV